MSEHIPMRQVFEMSSSMNRSTGIEGYQIAKVYEDPIKMIEERQLSQKKSKPKRKITKRGNYLDDQAKIYKLIPGPGKYKFKDGWPEKPAVKPRYSQKMTFIEEIMKREKKEKRPAPGHYKIFKSQKEIQAEKKLLSVRKIKEPERFTYLDSVQADSITRPGVGNYNVRRRAQTEMSFSKHSTKPEQMRKKHTEEDKKKAPKRPSMTTYSPNPCDYSLFCTMVKSKTKNWFGKSARFKTDQSGSGLNPTKYSILQQWAGKGKKIQRHGLDTISKARVHTSVYY